MKVTTFVESPKEKEFTETSRVFQWYESEEFEAYRALGYLMAWARLLNLEFSKLEIAPTTACKTL
jgi:hypothetical protein